jgi:hypothetical protein
MVVAAGDDMSDMGNMGVETLANALRPRESERKAHRFLPECPRIERVPFCIETGVADDAADRSNGGNVTVLRYPARLAPSRENNRIRPPQIPERLAQSSRREQTQARVGLRAIETDEVDIAGEAAVLEAVIEKDDVASEPLEKSLRRTDTIGAHRDHESRDRARELHRFVAALARVHEHVLAVGHENEVCMPLPAIASREHRDRELTSEKLSCPRGHERSLAAPTDGEIPDADDRNGELRRLDAVVVVVAHADGRAVEPRQR